MKKIGLPFMLFIVLFTLNQCSNQNPSSVGQTKSVQLAIAAPNGFDTVAQYAVAKVTGTDMDSIVQPLMINSNSITGTIRNIPAGSQRLFEVEVYGYNGAQIYYGSSYADIYQGLNTYVNITLHRPGGSATINGTIEDYPQDTEYVATPGMPYVRMTYDSGSSKFFSFGSDSSFNSLYHPVEYGWRIQQTAHYIVDTTRIDSILWTNTPQFNTWVSGSGSIRVQVMARCKLHTWIQSGWSQPLIIDLHDTADTSVVPPIDTMPPYNPDTLIDTMPPYNPDTLIDTMPPYPVIDSFLINFKAKDRIKPTDILLHAGDQVEIFASGSWNMDKRRIKNCGPAGDTTGLNDSLALFSFFPSGALLGEFMDVSDTAFYIGSSKSVVAPGTTHLLLLANCRAPALQGNESGQIKVYVNVKRHTI